MIDKNYTNESRLQLRDQPSATRSGFLASPQLLDHVFSLAIFSLTLFCGWYLTLAFPYGLWNAETPGYETLSRNFHWFAPNPLDWWRTFPLAILIDIASKLPNPTSAIYWVNTFLFSFSSALVYYLGRALFSSRGWGLALALSTLLFEIAEMNIFYNNLQISADPLFAELIHLGVLVALVGWLCSSAVTFLLGYLVLAMAIFTKPAGLAIAPLWFAFAFLARRRWSGNNRNNLVIAFASSVILIAPATIWSLRNFYLYGYPKVAGSGGCSLLLAALPVMSNYDLLFDDARTNAKFITTVRKCERDSGVDTNPNPSLEARALRYESYFVWSGKGAYGPFDFLAALTNPFWTGNRISYRFDSKHMFQIDQESGRIAQRIICQHPLGYVRRTIREYISMFSPQELWLDDGYYYGYNSKLSRAYGLDAPKLIIDYLLFPRTGIPNPRPNNEAIAQEIGAIVMNPILRSIFNCYFVSELLLTHLLFLAAVIGLIVAFKRQSQYLVNLNVVLIMLFLTASFNYLVVALMQVARWRYALAGDPELHLMSIIALFFLLRWLASGSLPAKIKSTFASRKHP
jgi:hypothetical protein